MTDTYDYDAFGNLLHSTAAGIPPGGATVSATPNEFLFAGEQFDSDLNLYYNRARYLNVSTGRFWTMDTYEGDSRSPLSLHKYLYGNGSPVNSVDPSGHQSAMSLVIAFALVSVLVGAAWYFSREPQQVAKEKVEGIAGVKAARELIARAIPKTTGDPTGFRYFFGKVDPGLVAQRYQLMDLAMAGQINFRSTTYHQCACIAQATYHQGTETPLDVAFSERYYPLEAYPRFDVMDHPTVDPSKGGVLIHEVSHGMFSTSDAAPYDQAHTFALKNPFDTYNNADTYRMFAEHEYLQ